MLTHIVSYLTQVVEFSPCETYVMTCNFETGDKAIIVWEVLTGQMLRAFPMAAMTVAGTGQWKLTLVKSVLCIAIGFRPFRPRTLIFEDYFSSACDV